MATTTNELFRAWRGGDADAGRLMAQRFADWYYAIATSRLGETRGREPCDSACQAFGQGVVGVTDPRALVKWAHGLIQERVSAAGARAEDGDEPSSYTGNQKPKDLLVRARGALPAEVGLLEAVYRGEDQARISQLAEPLGGNPIGILTARYRIKQWLRDQAGVPFEVAPDNPVLDRAPLPLYEANQMRNANEEASFEQWMLTDIDLCKDIAEFAHFSIALRGGLPTGAAAPKPQPAQKAAPKPAPAEQPKRAASPVPTASDDDLEPAGGGGGKAAIGIVAVLGGLALVAVVLVIIAVIAVSMM